MTYGKLSVADLYSLEQYSELRSEYRERALGYQSNRRVKLGEQLLLCFENKLTVQYQLQEVLRAARVFERETLESEIVAYTPLLPTGYNFKATMMLQLTSDLECSDLAGIGECVWLQIQGLPKVFATSDSRLKGHSTTQWLSFELKSDMRKKLKSGVAQDGLITVGVDHKLYRYEAALPVHVFESLVTDIADCAEAN